MFFYSSSFAVDIKAIAYFNYYNFDDTYYLHVKTRNNRSITTSFNKEESLLKEVNELANFTFDNGNFTRIQKYWVATDAVVAVSKHDPVKMALTAGDVTGGAFDDMISMIHNNYVIDVIFGSGDDYTSESACIEFSYGEDGEVERDDIYSRLVCSLKG